MLDRWRRRLRYWLHREERARLSEDVLQVEEGSLYPALQRLELNGWIEGEWGVSANNRRARMYKLTPSGRKILASETARYRQMTGAIARVMGMA